MYYAIHNQTKYIDTAFNATSTMSVREQVMAALAKQIGHDAVKEIAGASLESVLGKMGLTLHKQDEPFIIPTKFRVIAAVTTYCYLDVEANSEEEAKQIGENTDGGDFYTMEEEERPGSFNIVEVNPI